MDLTQQIINISKAGAYDIVSKQAQELQEENKALKNQLNAESDFQALQKDEIAYLKASNKELRDGLEFAKKEVENLYNFAISNGIEKAGYPPHVHIQNVLNRTNQ